MYGIYEMYLYISGGTLINEELEKRKKKYQEEKHKLEYMIKTDITKTIGDILVIVGLLMIAYSMFIVAFFHNILGGVVGVGVGIIFAQFGIDFMFIARIRNMYLEFGRKKC